MAESTLLLGSMIHDSTGTFDTVKVDMNSDLGTAKDEIPQGLAQDGHGGV